MLQMGEPYTGFRFVSIIPILFLAFFCLFALLQLVNEKFAIRASCLIGKPGFHIITALAVQ